jgi:lipoprotein-anchoring transpeptidase ErfK/SrfK
MAGGPGNPLGARAMYLGNTIYRIHGTNDPSTIGGARVVGLHPVDQR